MPDGSEAGGFGFENVKRNAMLASRGIALPKAWSTGTTIAGIMFKARGRLVCVGHCVLAGWGSRGCAQTHRRAHAFVHACIRGSGQHMCGWVREVRMCVRVRMHARTHARMHVQVRRSARSARRCKHTFLCQRTCTQHPA